jgi:hypothetical protein
MTTTTPKPKKVRLSLSITVEAERILSESGYASARTKGEFISRLIVEHHARARRKPTPTEVAAELRRLADVLEQKRGE